MTGKRNRKGRFFAPNYWRNKKRIQPTKGEIRTMVNAASTALSDNWKGFIDNFRDHIARYSSDFTHLYINRA